MDRLKGLSPLLCHLLSLRDIQVSGREKGDEGVVWGTGPQEPIHPVVQGGSVLEPVGREPELDPPGSLWPWGLWGGVWGPEIPSSPI